MRKGIVFLTAALLLITVRAEETDSPEETLASRLYVGAGASLTLPQGGSRVRRVGGGTLRAGYYLNDFWAFEGEAAWLEDCASLACGALWHWQGCSLYDRFFGFSRFDPFFTAGARGWIGRSAGQVGPKIGVGALWHLTDDWALRADADLTLGLDTSVETLYALTLGVQRSF